MRVVLIILLLLLNVLGANPGLDQPWPQVNGPFGNFTPRKAGVELVDDLSRARKVWESEDRDLGYAKGSVSGFLSHLARWDGHPGSCSGPIVADGKVFVTSFRPSGEAWAENQHGLADILDPNAKKPLEDAERKRLHENLRILADDLLVAIEVETGRTAWKAVEAAVGVNRYMGKRQGFCVSPAWHDGKVFSMGTTGMLRAYDSETGKRIWEKTIGEAHEKALAHKEKVLEEKMLPGGMGWDCSLTVAEGVLIVPLFDGRDLSLRGVDVEDGATLWEIEEACSRHATPSTWTHGGKQYVLTAAVSGTLQLIEPTSGKVLWKEDGLGENHYSLSPAGDYVFVNAGSALRRRPDDDAFYGILAGYRITPEGAERVWKHPEEQAVSFQTWMDSCARRFLAVDGERVYYYPHGPERADREFLVLEASTGKILARSPTNFASPQFYAIEDRILTVRDACHRETELGWFSADPDHFEPRSEWWDPPHQQCTAYEVLMEFPYSEGRIYMRTLDGGVVCYDLRLE